MCTSQTTSTSQTTMNTSCFVSSWSAVSFTQPSTSLRCKSRPLDRLVRPAASRLARNPADNARANIRSLPRMNSADEDENASTPNSASAVGATDVSPPAPSPLAPSPPSSSPAASSERAPMKIDPKRFQEYFPGEPMEPVYKDQVPGKIELSPEELAEQKRKLEEYAELLRKDRIRTERENARLFGFVKYAETMNGRFAMFFFVTGLLTEYWTDYTIPEQIELLLRSLGVI